VLRLLAVAVVSLIANAVGLLVASLILDDVELDWSGFIVAVAIFTGVAVLIEPLIRQTAMKNVPALLGSTALLATLVSLVVTNLITDGLNIQGTVTWVLATVIVWAVALAARLLLPFVIFKKVLNERRSG
jgi:putative membrane protein